MARFSDLGIRADCIIGKGIDFDELFDRRIIIEKVKIDQSKFKGKNQSGLLMQMQIVLAKFNDEPDAQGDYYVKDENGAPKGERRCAFTGSDILIETMQTAMEQCKSENVELFPMDTTIVKVGKCSNFT